MMNNAAGYVDLQVNGYGGVDFNGDTLSATALHRACEMLRRDGVAGILATIVTDQPDIMQRRLARIAALRRLDSLVADVVWGVHIEGPFLSDLPGYIGAHPRVVARPADPEIARRLVAAADGLVRLVTLAPERDAGGRVTRLLAAQDIRVAAGHCNPSLDQLKMALDNGLTMFTHLGNGCPLHLHRHDNIIQRVLSLADRLWISWIADGVHVPFTALGNYFRCAGLDRSLVVTDAIFAAGLGPGRYTSGSQELVVDDRLATWSPDKSHLMGAASTMPRVVENLRHELGLEDSAITRLTRDNPRRVLGS